LAHVLGAREDNNFEGRIQRIDTVVEELA
jgi:hypothetical protein